MNSPTRIRRTRSAHVGSITTKVTALSAGRVRRADTSRQVEPDYSGALVGGTAPLTPPYDPEQLAGLLETSNMLQQCVAAYITNVAMYGWEIAPTDDTQPMDPEEQAELQSFIDSPNCDESLTTVAAKLVGNHEHYGYGFIEVIRDRKNRPTILRHAPSRTTRLCPKDPTPIAVEYDVMRGRRTAYVTEMRTFRIYRQHSGGQFVYFKEFGDPRRLSYKTGLFEAPGRPVPKGEEATELLHFRQHSDDSYGTPRWIAQLPSVLGSREVEEVNLRYFQDNTVPPMILSVAGGRLTGESHRDLKRLLNSQGVGKERQNQILLIEAMAERDSLDDKANPVQLKVDKLTDARPSDGLFKDYDEGNQAKVRSSFRLPPVTVGLSEDVTFATANVSAFVAETQVFLPLRQHFDERWNKGFVNHPLGLGLKTVKLRSKSPTITNPEMLIKAMTALNVMGAVTPRTAQDVARKVLQVEIPAYPEKGAEGYEDWMDRPIIFATKSNSTADGHHGTDPAGAGNTHDAQNLKDPATKALESTGDVSPRSPENGQQ